MVCGQIPSMPCASEDSASFLPSPLFPINELTTGPIAGQSFRITLVSWAWMAQPVAAPGGLSRVPLATSVQCHHCPHLLAPNPLTMASPAALLGDSLDTQGRRLTGAEAEEPPSRLTQSQLPSHCISGWCCPGESPETPLLLTSATPPSPPTSSGLLGSTIKKHCS